VRHDFESGPHHRVSSGIGLETALAFAQRDDTTHASMRDVARPAQAAAAPMNPSTAYGGVVTVNPWTEPSHARDYLGQRERLSHQEEGYAALLEFLPSSPRRVLDLGTGDGYLLSRIRALHPDVDGIAVDFSTEMLGRARARFAGEPAVTVIEHDLDEALPVTWGTFDVVVSSHAIHHVDHARKRALYGEVRDLLEPGGQFCNLDHVASPTPELRQAFLVARGRSPADHDPPSPRLDVETQLVWLRELGFEQVDCHWKWRELALLAGAKPV